MTGDLEGQRVLTPEDLGALPLSDEINHVVGDTATLLTRPAGAHLIVLRVAVDEFRVAVGDRVGSDEPTDPSATISDGAGSLLLTRADGAKVFSAPARLSVKGSVAGSILDYYWLDGG